MTLSPLLLTGCPVSVTDGVPYSSGPLRSSRSQERKPISIMVLSRLTLKANGKVGPYQLATGQSTFRRDENNHHVLCSPWDVLLACSPKFGGGNLFVSHASAGRSG